MADRHVATRCATRIGLIVVALTTAIACGPRHPPGARARPLGGLVIVCEPADALLFVNDKFLGSVEGLKRRPLHLPEGTHRLELRRDGYFAHYAEIKMVRGVQQRVRVKLRKEPF